MLRKKFISITLILSMLGTGVVYGNNGNHLEVKVNVNGNLVKFPDVKPFINHTNRTIVPVRFVSEHLGYETIWSNQSRSIKLKKGSQTLYFRIGEYDSVVINSRTYVPLRYVAEAFDAEVHWNEKERLATILTEVVVSEPTAPVEEPVNPEEPGELLLPAQASSRGWEKKADEVIALAETFYGVDYKYGAKAGRTDLFDCSSLTQYVFWKNGIKLRRASRPQFLYDGDKVLTREELRKGDLVFFSTAGTAKKYSLDDYQRNGHVGIVKEVKKNGEIVFIHTYQKGIGVTDSKMRSNLEKGWWNRHFLYGKRVIADDGTAALDLEVNKADINQYIK